MSHPQRAWRGRSRGRGTGPAQQSTRAGPKTNELNMELIASISRSSGLQADGDTLKDHKIQEQYWLFVLKKLSDYWHKYEGHETDLGLKQHQDEARHSILIFFRKLREGVAASHRQDSWALRVFEVSLYVAAIFTSPAQVSSVLIHTRPQVYANVNNSPIDSQPADQQTTILLALLHHLNFAYPSQAAYRDFLQSNSQHAFSDTGARSWIFDLASALRTLNYHRLGLLCTRTSYEHFVAERISQTPLPIGMTLSSLARQAVRTLVGQILSKARISAWAVLRNAYPIFACHRGSGTRVWMKDALMLCLDPQLGNSTIAVDRWLAERAELGEISQQEEIEGKWVVRKKV